MFLDSSVLVELLLNEPRSQSFEQIFALIEDEPVFISVIQIGEVSDWCLKNGVEPQEALVGLKEIVEIMPLTEKVVLDGSRLKYQMRAQGLQKFSLMDGIILACAISLNEKLLTLDWDFRLAENVIVLDRP